MVRPLAIEKGASLRGYAAAILTVAASTLIGLVMAPRWGNSAVDLVYLPAVLAVAVIAGFGPAICAAIISALAYNYFFTAPYHTLRIHSPSDIVTVIALFLVALVTSHLAASIRRQAQLARSHAERNATIAGLARRLLSCAGEQEIAKVATNELGLLFGCNAVLLAGRPEPQVVASVPAAATLTPGDIASVAMVLANGQPTGRGISPVTIIEWQFHPVSSESGAVAVVGLARNDGAPAVGSEQLSLLQSLLDQVALALDRARLESEARQFATVRERDRIRSALLSSIGEDLKPSLSAIGAAARELRRGGSSDTAAVSTIASHATKMDRYIANLVELGPGSDSQPIAAGGVVIDLFQRSVCRNGKDVHLTPKEYAVLAELAKHPGRVLSHAHLLRAAWGPAQEKQTEYVRVAIRSLRQKLESDPSHPVLIINEPAVGYRLMAGQAALN